MNRSRRVWRMAVADCAALLILAAALVVLSALPAQGRPTASFFPNVIAETDQPEPSSPMAEPLPPTAPERVLYVGDSITEGVEHLTGHANGRLWWSYVDEAMGTEGTVHAVSGWRSIDAVASNPPAGNDHVFMALGANDFWMEPAETRANLEKLAALGDRCTVIAPWARTGFAEAMLENRTAPHGEYVQAAAGAALDAGCSFVDWSELSSEGRSYDGIHPTPAGSAELGGLVAGHALQDWAR